MTILDRANAFIGHEQEIDKGCETTMRRNAFIAGFKEALSLMKKLRDAQKEELHFGLKLDEKYRGNYWLMTNEEISEQQKRCNEISNIESEIDKLLEYGEL